MIKDNVLDINQNQKIEEFKDALLNRENATDTNLINITEIQNLIKRKKIQILMKQMKDQLKVGMSVVVKGIDI